MRKFLIKTNEWYDKLPEIPRALAFIIGIMLPIVVCQYLMFVEHIFWPFFLFALIVMVWRIGGAYAKYQKK